MKKVFFTLALALGLTLTVAAQSRGLFDYGPTKGTGENYYTDNYDRDPNAPLFALPSQHGEEGDVSTPLGTGTAILLGLGAAYLVGKKTRKK